MLINISHLFIQKKGGKTLSLHLLIPVVKSHYTRTVLNNAVMVLGAGVGRDS